ncbi:hypothetical protein ACQI4L_03250 [Mycolicibacterium litorale]|uniref:hypothetical protein n=1 Tax=Mycolicibacterium litorale TaxID=758802 RepID=UPI003CF4FE9D
MQSSFGSLGADLVTVRIWELASLALFVYGLVLVRRKGNPVFWCVYSASALVILFDWIWNRNWFGAVSYSDLFIPAWSARGELQPFSLAFVYCFFFGIPMIVLLEKRSDLDRRFGKLQWPLLFAMFAVPQMPFEVLASEVLHLWVYHVVPPWAVFGVPWSNAIFSGLVGCGFYAAGRLALRWTWQSDAATFLQVVKHGGAGLQILAVYCGKIPSTRVVCGARRTGPTVPR